MKINAKTAFEGVKRLLVVQNRDGALKAHDADYNGAVTNAGVIPGGQWVFGPGQGAGKKLPVALQHSISLFIRK